MIGNNDCLSSRTSHDFVEDDPDNDQKEDKNDATENRTDCERSVETAFQVIDRGLMRWQRVHA